MKAKIVLGLQFGDEGKGITTDYLCSSKCVPSDTVVVRFSGGQQAGHTVVKDGISHVFASFGSGTLAGCPTYLSEHCTFYPPNIINEYKSLKQKGIKPQLCIHPKAMCTTPYDIAFNRWREKIVNHGSCGIGVGATMKRNLESPYKFYATDLLFPALLAKKFVKIKHYYTDKVVELGGHASDFMDIAVVECENFYGSLITGYMENLIQFHIKSYDFLTQYRYIVFEGSQGIMLDIDHGLFPHVTYAHTTSKNAIEICEKLGMDPDDIEIYYVTRCYQTRHGEGWMSNSDEIKLINNENETNVTNKWQKEFKVGEIDYQLLNYAMKCDSYSWKVYGKNLVVTCLDQRPDFSFDYTQLNYNPFFLQILESYSPESKNMVNARTKALT